MAVYKQKASKFWWYKFTWKGDLVRESTKQTNKRVAEQIEAAHKTRLAKGEAGIVELTPAPTLSEFAVRFMEAIEVRCAAKPRTVSFYREKLTRLLEYEPLAKARLDQIDESLIEGFIQERRKYVAPATVNRALATLRRALRLAYEWKIVNRLPRIRLLPGERNRQFVLSQNAEVEYLKAVAQPLRDIAVLILDAGLRVGEALALQWADVQIHPAMGARYGYIRVREGKSANARRNVSMTARVQGMLSARASVSTSQWVFPSETGKPYLGTSLNHVHQRARALLKFPSDFVIHSLRHTMLTRMGEAGVDAFSIMRIAGHSSVTVSQRYVHPSPEALERAFEKLEVLNTVARRDAGIELGIAPLLADGVDSVKVFI